MITYTPLDPIRNAICLKIVARLKQIVELLVEKRYEEIDLITNSKMCKAAEVMELISSVEEILILPPDQVYQSYSYQEDHSTIFFSGDLDDALNLWIYPFNEPLFWGIEFNMWTQYSDNSPSDWVLKLEMRDAGKMELDVELRVLCQD